MSYNRAVLDVPTDNTSSIAKTSKGVRPLLIFALAAVFILADVFLILALLNNNSNFGLANVTPTSVPAEVTNTLKEANTAFWVKGEQASALEKLHQLSFKYPGYAIVWRDYGFALTNWTEDESGIIALEKATQLDPKDVRTWFYLEAGYIKSHRYTEAEKAAKTAAQLDPNGWQGHAALAAFYEATFKLDLAESEVAAMQKAANLALATDDPLYNAVLATQLFFQDDPKGALEAWDKVLKVWPKSASALANKGNFTAFQSSNPTELKANQQAGLRLLQDALSLQPQSSIITALLAYHYVFGGNYNNAEKYAQAALKLNSSNPMAIEVTGYVALYKKDYTRSVQNFEHCTQLDIYHASCFFGWSAVLASQGNELQAQNKAGEANVAFKAALEKALKGSNYFPNNGKYIISASFFQMVGYCYYNLADYETAINYYQKAVSAYPEVASLYGYLGFAYLSSGDSKAAQVYYNKGTGLDPNDAVLKSLKEKLAKS